MSQACSISAGRVYGLQRVCRVWHGARSTVYERRRRHTDPAAIACRSPQGPCSDEPRVEPIRTVIRQSPFHGQGDRKIWGTDMTTTGTIREGKVAVFGAVDHCTAECLGIHASNSQSRCEALEPLRQGVREKFGASALGQGIAEGLKIRHDHGSQYVADAFQDELKFLGMVASPSFVREPQGNGCAERFIRTL